MENTIPVFPEDPFKGMDVPFRICVFRRRWLYKIVPAKSGFPADTSYFKRKDKYCVVPVFRPAALCASLTPESDMLYLISQPGFIDVDSIIKCFLKAADLFFFPCCAGGFHRDRKTYPQYKYYGANLSIGSRSIFTLAEQSPGSCSHTKDFCICIIL